MIAGFFFIAFGIVLILNSGLGANSWNVLHIGLSLSTPLTLGQSIQIVSLILVIVNWCLGERPGLATILKMVAVGWFVDLIVFINLVPLAGTWFTQYLDMIGGTLCMGLGSAVYIKTDLGRGPRDGFMFALQRLTSRPLILVRTVIEAGALVLGILLKGPFGIGSIVITLTFGWVLQGSLSFFKLLEKKLCRRGSGSHFYRV
ncbi:MAG: hypothetical protein GX881_09290 [Firmicutes bacterium]|nr:hypothetical protein [Bacillota bacterium]